jgi:alkylhydroperoxidase/carboxymuconolactone decarboxylase family protein YurZ
MVDIYTDKDNTVLKQFMAKHSYAVSELEKIASEEGVELLDKNELTKEAFADKENKMFPVYDKTSTLMSALYVAAQPDEIPVHVKEAVQKSCDIFGIEADLMNIEKVAEQKVNGLEQDDFVFPASRKLPVVDPETYSMSETVFLKEANDLEVEDVIIGARRLYAKAHQYNVTPDSNIEKLAMFNGVNREELSEYLNDVYFQTGNNNMRELKEYVTKEASANELPAIALEIIKMYNNGEGGQAANVLKRLSAEDKEKVIKILNKELGIEKIASIDKQTWKEMFIEDDIDFKDELGNFDKVAFERMLTQMTPTEQALLVKFIEQQN